jgi:hypothetical protein
MVYVVVCVGETATLPAAPVTVPTPLSMLSVVAPRDFQLSVDCCPGVMFAGLAVSVTESGAFTVACAVAVAVPFVAVIVYVVVAAGLTVMLPLGAVTDPIP